MGGGRSQRLRGDRKRSRPERHGNAVGEQSQLRFLRLLSGRRRPGQQRLDRRDGNPGRTDLPQRRMQHAVCLYGGMHPRGGTRRGGALQVPPADDHGYDPGGILGGRGGTEARAVERERPHSGRLHVRHRNRPVHGHPGQRIERAGPAPDVGGRPLHSAQRRVEGRGHGVHAAAGHRGAHALRRHHAGQNIQLHNPGNAQGRAPLFVHDRRHAGTGATDLGRLFRLDGLPARQHLPVAGFHPRIARRLHDLRFALRVTKAGCPAKDTTSNGCRTSYSAI